MSQQKRGWISDHFAQVEGQSWGKAQKELGRVESGGENSVLTRLMAVRQESLISFLVSCVPSIYSVHSSAKIF